MDTAPHEKCPLDEVEEVVLRLLPLCKEQKAIFILDDHVELAHKIGVNGVHVGKTDMPVSEARSYLGKKFIIGGTANTLEDIETHYRAGASYIGLSPFRFTTTKTNLSPVLGLQGYRDILSAMKEQGIDIPVVAIGGITPGDIPGLMATSIAGIALSGTILQATDPVAMTKQIINT